MYKRQVFAIADRASILRDGTYITTLNMKETSKEELIRHICLLYTSRCV